MSQVGNGTGAINPGAVTVRRVYSTGCLEMTLWNLSGSTLYAGQEVVLSGNGQVTARTNATGTRPIGIVTVGGVTGATVTVQLNGQCYLKGVAKGGALSANGYARQDGTLASGIPNYVTAASGTVATARVLTGGAEGATIEVIVPWEPVLVP